MPDSTRRYLIRTAVTSGLAAAPAVRPAWGSSSPYSRVDAALVHIGYHPRPEISETGEEEVDHFDNLISPVRSRDHQALYYEIEEGYMCTSLCRLANISHRVGGSLVFDLERETFLNDQQANLYWSRRSYEPHSMPARG